MQTINSFKSHRDHFNMKGVRTITCNNCGTQFRIHGTKVDSWMVAIGVCSECGSKSFHVSSTIVEDMI